MSPTGMAARVAFRSRAAEVLLPTVKRDDCWIVMDGLARGGTDLAEEIQNRFKVDGLTGAIQHDGGRRVPVKPVAIIDAERPRDVLSQESGRRRAQPRAYDGKWSLPASSALPISSPWPELPLDPGFDQDPMPHTMQTVHETILHLLDQLSASYSQRRADDYLACFAEPSMVYGTGIDEKCLGADEIRLHLDRDWAQSSHASFTLNNPQIEVASGAAWVASDCHYDFSTDDGDGRMAGRVTFVLVYADGQWRIRHAHFSVPFGAKGNSF